MENSITEFFGLVIGVLISVIFIGYIADIMTIENKFEQNIQNAEVVRMQAQVRADENKFHNIEVLYTDVISIILRSRNSDLTITVTPNNGTHGGVWSPDFQTTAFDMMQISNRLTQTSLYFVEITRGYNDEVTGYNIQRK